MSRQSNQPSKNPIAALQKPPIFKLLNRKHLTFIFKYLDVEDLSRLRVTCRRMNNAVEHYVDALQVFVDWSEDYMVGFRQSPVRFVYHNPLGSPFD